MCCCEWGWELNVPSEVHLLFFQPGCDMQNQVASCLASYIEEVTVDSEISCSLTLSLPVHAQW